MIVLRSALITILLILFFADQVFSKPVSVRQITRKTEQYYTRIVVEVDGLKDFNLIPDMERRRLLLHIPGATVQFTADRHLEDERMSIITSSSPEEGTTAYVTIKKHPFSFHYYVLDNPSRIVLDIKERDKKKVLGFQVKKPKTEITEQEEFLKKKGLNPSMLDEAKELYGNGLRKFAGDDSLGAIKDFQILTLRFGGSRYAEVASYIIGEAFYQLALDNDHYYELALDAYRVAISSYGDNHRRESALFKMAGIYLKKSLKLEAKATFQMLVEDYPKGKYAPRALLAKSTIYSDQGRFKEAYNELEKVLFLYPFSPVVRGATFGIADSYFREEEFHKAAEIYRNALKKWPSFPKSNPDTLFYMAETFYQVGDFNVAKKFFYQMVNLYPDFGLASASVLRLADIYAAQGMEGKGLKLYASAIAMFPAPETVDARMQMADMGFNKEGKIEKENIFDFSPYEDPEGVYKTTLEEFPESEEAMSAMFGIGKVLQREKRYLEAVAQFEEVVRMYPETEIAEKGKEELRSLFFNLVTQYHSQDGFFQVLILHYNRFEPFFEEVHNPEILYEIGDSYSQVGLHEKALKFFKAVEKEDKKKKIQEQTLLSQGKALFKVGRYKESEAKLKKQLQRFKKGRYATEGWAYLGDVLMARKKRPEAYNSYAKAVNKIKGRQGKAEILIKMAENQRMRKRYKSAILDYRKAIAMLKLTPAGEGREEAIADLRFNVFSSLYHGGKIKEAIQEADVLKKAYPEDERTSWVMYMAAEGLRRLKKEKSSEELFVQLSQSNAGLVQQVASVEAAYMKWKQEHPDLFSGKRKKK